MEVDLDCTVEDELYFEVIDHVDEGNSIEPRFKKIISVFLLFLFYWQSLFWVSDSAIGLMLSFIAKFLTIIANSFNLQPLVHIASSMPRTLYKSRKWLGKLKEKFIIFVVCPTCHTVYSYEESVEVQGGLVCVHMYAILTICLQE